MLAFSFPPRNIVTSGRDWQWLSKWVNKYTIIIRISISEGTVVCAMYEWAEREGLTLSLSGWSGKCFFEELIFKLNSTWWESTCKNGKWSGGQSILAKKKQNVPNPETEARLWHGQETEKLSLLADCDREGQRPEFLKLQEGFAVSSAHSANLADLGVMKVNTAASLRFPLPRNAREQCLALCS